jgi:hypothetical protein
MGQVVKLDKAAMEKAASVAQARAANDSSINPAPPAIKPRRKLHGRRPASASTPS